jgi:hypothetical protein
MNAVHRQPKPPRSLRCWGGPVSGPPSIWRAAYLTEPTLSEKVSSTTGSNERTTTNHLGMDFTASPQRVPRYQVPLHKKAPYLQKRVHYNTQCSLRPNLATSEGTSNKVTRTNSKTLGVDLGGSYNFPPQCGGRLHHHLRLDQRPQEKPADQDLRLSLWVRIIF